MEMKFIVLIALTITKAESFSDVKYTSEYCPQLFQMPFKGYVPRGNITAGKFTEIEDAKTLKNCVISCCVKQDCNVAFMNSDKCYHIHCVNNEPCMPTLSPNPRITNDIIMVLVRPVLPEESWQSIFRQEAWKEDFGSDVYNVLSPRMKNSFKNLVYDNSKELIPPDDVYEYVPCEIGMNSCPKNEYCEPNNVKSRAGTCRCKEGYFRNNVGECEVILYKEDLSDGEEKMTEKIENLSNITDTKKELKVIAENKEVKLPKNEVSLTATVNPPPGEDEKYQYEWTSLQQPEGSSAVKHQNGETLQLSKLNEGLYTFKVSAAGLDSYGETFVNVTVLPPSRTNQPPQIVITPANQTIKLPNTVAVLDASSSTDDDGIASWHWELQQGPIGYNPQLSDTNTLQLNDLSKPGNYTFKLTVTDTDKATNTSTANITVLKVTDYPPEANAGQDVIIYLPHNKLTLNGNQSTDDHMITTWEWTKSADDAQKAVDMQDTRTPYLQLSDLEEGMYTFVLKVTDSANQSSTAQVHVYVKPPTNQPPIADAGDNVTISLPQTWVELNANKSKDDNKIVSFHWEQIEGPSSAVFVNQNNSVTNVTGLTKGVYCFKVYVADENKNVATNVTYVTVNQNNNQKPTANAGDDLTIELPRNAIYLNGSKSHDDWAVTRWKWTRDEKSLAIGNIAENSDATSILILTDMSPGVYIFNLTVYDEQGLSDTDTVTVTVKGDPMLYHLVELTLNCNVNYLTEAQYSSLQGKLALLVKDETKLIVRGMKPVSGTGMAMITFYVETKDVKPLPANDVVQHLREKLKVDAKLLGFSVAKLQTAICQNNCSGHGVCDEQTRRCICEAFWMHDMFKVYFRSGEDSDCSWSILYVVLGFACGLVMLLGSLWACIFLCISWCSRRRLNRKPSTYKLIEDTEDLPPFASRKNDLSDSDTDSDVVFESRNKSSRFSNDSRNGYKSNRNGYSKVGRRIKT